jgi:hypothetical protein
MTVDLSSSPYILQTVNIGIIIENLLFWSYCICLMHKTLAFCPRDILFPGHVKIIHLALSLSPKRSGKLSARDDRGDVDVESEERKGFKWIPKLWSRKLRLIS